MVFGTRGKDEPPNPLWGHSPAKDQFFNKPRLLVPNEPKTLFQLLTTRNERSNEYFNFSVQDTNRLNTMKFFGLPYLTCYDYQDPRCYLIGKKDATDVMDENAKLFLKDIEEVIERSDEVLSLRQKIKEDLEMKISNKSWFRSKDQERKELSYFEKDKLLDDLNFAFLDYLLISFNKDKFDRVKGVIDDEYFDAVNTAITNLFKEKTKDNIYQRQVDFLNTPKSTSGGGKKKSKSRRKKNTRRKSRKTRKI
jgi:hypothetical protein